LAALKEIEISILGGMVSAKYFKGNGSIPLMMIHGWLDNLESFSPLLEALMQLEQSHPILALDLPGHGHSFHHSPDHTGHFIDMVTDLLMIMDAMHWDKVILVGHSMGAAISSLICATQPERIAGFVSIEMMGPLSETSENVVQRLALHFSAMSKPSNPLKIYSSLQQAMETRAVKASPPIAYSQAMVARNLESHAAGFVWKTDRRLRIPSAIRLTEEQVCVVLKSIQCPVLYVEGEVGYKELQQSSQKRSPWIQNLTQITLKGGHHCHMETPDILAKTMLGFINSECVPVNS